MRQQPHDGNYGTTRSKPHGCCHTYDCGAQNRQAKHMFKCGLWKQTRPHAPRGMVHTSLHTYIPTIYLMANKPAGVNHTCALYFKVCSPPTSAPHIIRNNQRPANVRVGVANTARSFCRQHARPPLCHLHVAKCVVCGNHKSSTPKAQMRKHSLAVPALYYLSHIHHPYTHLVMDPRSRKSGAETPHRMPSTKVPFYWWPLCETS